MRAVTNLTVHGIGRTTRELDPGEGDTWVSLAQFEQVVDAVAGRPDVRLTFDDGNLSDVEIALPRLVERGLKAEFFVLAGLLGEPGRLDSDGVRELLGAGMRIGSHGWAHRDWRTLGTREAAEELSAAHHLLGQLVGEPVSRVAIPFGSYDRLVLNRLRRMGVTRAYTSDGGRARPGSWLQPRTSLRHDLDRGWIARVLGGPSLPRRAAKLATRLYKRMR
ncbi:polysaccharide deacetylase family protein [Nonomuraea harbinensis]|uniref:Polysaccharide deacetylase family protein n=1 Tax=Nonomuraea harbinensis TaxID=1286938 RepID=A0ABW1CAD4_9ACTN|nr:polysaccharide deacetylase family protein [Nonomuraea harbinensis]